MIVIREQKETVFEIVSGVNDLDLTLGDEVEILYNRCISHLTETWDSPTGPTSFRHKFVLDNAYYDALLETCGEGAFMDRLIDYVEGLIRDLTIIDGKRIAKKTILRVITTGTYEEDPDRPFSITVELREVSLSEVAKDSD